MGRNMHVAAIGGLLLLLTLIQGTRNVIFLGLPTAAGNQHDIARVRSFWIPPTLILVLRLISRMDRPADSRSLITSRILRIVVLLAGMVSLP